MFYAGPARSPTLRDGGDRRPQKRTKRHTIPQLEYTLERASQTGIESPEDIRPAARVLINLVKGAGVEKATVTREQQQQVIECTQKLVGALLSPAPWSPPTYQAEGTPASTPSPVPKAALAELDNKALWDLCDTVYLTAKIPGVPVPAFSAALVEIAAQRFSSAQDSPGTAWDRWLCVTRAAEIGALHYERDAAVRELGPVIVKHLAGLGVETGPGKLVRSFVWSHLLQNLALLGVPASVAEPLLTKVAGQVTAEKTIMQTWVTVAESLAAMGSRNPQMVAVCASKVAACAEEDDSVRLHLVARVVHALVKAGASKQQVQPAVAAASAAIKAGRADSDPAFMRGLSREQVAADLKALGIKDDVFEKAFLNAA